MTRLKKTGLLLAALAAACWPFAGAARGAERPAAVSEELPLSKEAKAVADEEQGLAVEVKREKTLLEQLAGKPGQPLSRDQQMSLGTELKTVQERKAAKLEELARKRERLAKSFESQGNSSGARQKILTEGAKLQNDLKPMTRDARTRARIATITGAMTESERRDLSRRKRVIGRMVRQLPRIDAALGKERRSRDRAMDMASYQRTLAAECRIRAASAGFDATETDLALRALALDAANKGSAKTGGDGMADDDDAVQTSLIDLLHLETPEPASAPGEVPVEEWVEQLAQDGQAPGT